MLQNLNFIFPGLALRAGLFALSPRSFQSLWAFSYNPLRKINTVK